MTTATRERAGTDVCGECHEPVLIRYTDHHKRVVLDPEPELVGLYSLDENGRAIRRRLVDMAAEAQGKLNVGGYAPHECAFWSDSRYLV